MQAMSQSDDVSALHGAIQLPIFRRASPAPAAAPVPKVVSAPEAPAPVVSDPKPAAPQGSVPPAVQCVTKLALEELAAGDKVVVKTGNSTYSFEMLDDLCCKVVPSKSSARSGEAFLAGCLNADASEHTPNRIFVGGRLAYQFPDEDTCIMTSLVESIFWVPARRNG